MAMRVMKASVTDEAYEVLERYFTELGVTLGTCAQAFAEMLLRNGGFDPATQPGWGPVVLERAREIALERKRRGNRRQE